MSKLGGSALLRDLGVGPGLAGYTLYDVPSHGDTLREEGEVSARPARGWGRAEVGGVSATERVALGKWLPLSGPQRCPPHLSRWPSQWVSVPSSGRTRIRAPLWTQNPSASELEGERGPCSAQSQPFSEGRLSP